MEQENVMIVLVRAELRSWSEFMQCKISGQDP